MLTRFTDPDNIDPATGTNLDSLDFIKKMNGSNDTRARCGKAYVYKWAQLPGQPIEYFVVNPQEAPSVTTSIEE